MNESVKYLIVIITIFVTIVPNVSETDVFNGLFGNWAFKVSSSSEILNIYNSRK